MKKNLSVLLGALVPCALLMGACGDDVYDADDIVDQDSGSRPDATQIPGALDSGPDARTDSGSDGGSDAEADADADVPDADAGPVTDPAIAVFVNALGAAACQNYDTCCTGRLGPDVTPATPSCSESVATDNRFFGGLLNAYYYTAGVATGTRVTIDPTLAASCLTKVAALGCFIEGVPAADWKAVLQDCSGALTGIGVTDDACLSDLECARGFSCIGAAPAGTLGACTALRASGQPHQNSAQYDGDSCSYRGYGFGTGLRVGRQAEGGPTLCLPQRQLGEQCQPFTPVLDFQGSDQDCLSYACGFVGDGETGFVCVDTETDFFQCAQYRIDVP